jgi:hypothetical protein
MIKKAGKRNFTEIQGIDIDLFISDSQSIFVHLFAGVGWAGTNPALTQRWSLDSAAMLGNYKERRRRGWRR